VRRLAAGSLALLLFAGCAVGPNYKQPALEVPTEYREVQGPPAPPETLADQPWWEVFGDPVLQRLIDEALAGNYDVRIAAWRVDEFRARAGIARSEFFPSINYGGGWARGRNSAQVFPFTSVTANQIDANVNFGWELDVWGRIRRLNEAAKAEYLSSEDARRGVLLSLVSDVAKTYFTLRELDAELVITKNTVAAFQETYDLFERKLQEGAASALETSYAAAALGQVAAQIPEVERRIEATENLLNLLLGRNPGPIERGAGVDAQPVPAEVPAGIPSELLQRRPDVRGAEQQLIAANATVGVAVANFFPTISLTGLFGAVSPDIDNFYPGGKIWSIAAGLVGPLFQGGRLRSQYDVAWAQWEQTKAAYEQVVTNAFSETTTVLYARQKIAATVDELEATVDAYREMVRLSQVRYNSGLSNYFEVLYAMQLLFPAEIALVRARLDYLVDYVDIYKALGGGWNIENPTWQSPGSPAPPPAEMPEDAPPAQSTAAMP
jgi:multidrug efflux system outer membrane protein